MFLEDLDLTYSTDCLGEALFIFSLIPDDLHQRTVGKAPKIGMLRMKPLKEKPRKRGRIEGRQAPTTPRELSTIDQYTSGVKMSVFG